MYLNLKYLKEKDLLIRELCLLQLIKQNSGEDMSEFLSLSLSDVDIEKFEKLGYLGFIKPKKKSDTKYMLVRITNLGLKTIEYATTPEIENGDTKMAEYLIDMYLKEDDKRVIGNRKNVVLFTCQFRKHCSLTLHQMYYLCELFISETKYTLKLENIFFDSNKHRYGKFLNHIEDSKLFQFYNERREDVENYWKTKIKTDE